MKQLNLQPIARRDQISRDEFQEEFVRTNKPVILSCYSANWSARKKWSLEYFQSRYPDLMVPVYDDAFATSGKSYTNADNKMRFADYLELIATKPTKLRMFLFNIFKHIPDLCNDFDYPEIVDNYVTKYPFMFFGGATSFVDAHFDLDLSHVFLTQFLGKKKVILYGPEYGKHLYRHPFTVSTNVDLGNPDFDRYPRLLEAKGYECELSDGETLFIPTGWWHYIYYKEGGYSLSLRSHPTGMKHMLRTGIQMFNLLFLDNNISKILGAKKWYALKERMAIKRAEDL